MYTLRQAMSILVLSGNNLRMMHATEAEWLVLLFTLPDIGLLN